MFWLLLAIAAMGPAFVAAGGEGTSKTPQYRTFSNPGTSTCIVIKNYNQAYGMSGV